MNATYIKSYTHAQQLGIRPVDTLIGTVAIPSKKPKILAFRASHGFSARDTGKYTKGKMKEYVSNGERFFATNKPMLDILLKVLFKRKPRVYQVTLRKV